MATISADSLAAAARGLMLAGRWADAADLLSAAAPDSDAERAVLAVSAAAVAIEQDFFIKTTRGSSALARASATIGGAPAEVVFDLDFLALKHDYNAELFGPPSASFAATFSSPAWRTPEAAAALAARAGVLRDRAPDDGRRAWATFYAGVIAELLAGDPDSARSYYTDALRLGESSGDDLVVSYAARHLGYLAHGDGDRDAARALLQRSLELRQRLGCVPITLAQQLALAEVDAESGPAAAATAARAVAEVIRGWAGQAFPGSWLVLAAEGLLVSASDSDSDSADG